jgi:hypothetical protein
MWPAAKTVQGCRAVEVDLGLMLEPPETMPAEAGLALAVAAAWAGIRRRWIVRPGDGGHSRLRRHSQLDRFGWRARWGCGKHDGGFGRHERRGQQLQRAWRKRGRCTSAHTHPSSGCGCTLGSRRAESGAFSLLGLGTKPVDTVAARGSQNLWFDHLNLTDGPDGMLDLTKGSDHATVSWCKISYTTSNRDHRLSLLFGAGSTESETDTGKNNHTVHHNWFAQNVDQRMPRVLFGMSHVFNNFYSSPGNLYCIGSGSFASVLIENNYFKDVKSPHQFADTNHAYIAATGNVYDNTTGNRDTGLGGTTGASVAAWTPSYAYKLDKGEDVPGIVQRCAGPQ